MGDWIWIVPWKRWAYCHENGKVADCETDWETWVFCSRFGKWVIVWATGEPRPVDE